MGIQVNGIDKLINQSIRMGYKTELTSSPEWMLPYDKMLVVKMERSGFIHQVVLYNK